MKFTNHFLAAMLGMSALSAQADSYTLTDLTYMNGAGIPYSMPYGINNNNQIVGVSAVLSRPFSFIYSNGQTVVLPTGQGPFVPGDNLYAFSEAHSINDNGMVTGYSITDSTPPHAFLYSNGELNDIGTPGSAYPFSYGLGVNNNGEVAGFGQITSGDFHTSAFVYANGQMTDLGAQLGFYNSEAVAVNNSGLVAGFGSAANDPEHAFLYNNGITTDLGTFGGPSSIATAINSLGEVVGRADIKAFYNHAFLFSAGQMIDLGSLNPEESSGANAINDLGQIVGFSYERAFIYSNGVMTDLNSLIAVNPSLTLTDALAINNNGMILATGKNNYTGVMTPYLLTPVAVPLPAVGWLFAGILPGLAMRRKVR